MTPQFLDVVHVHALSECAQKVTWIATDGTVMGVLARIKLGVANKWDIYCSCGKNGTKLAPTTVRELARRYSPGYQLPSRLRALLELPQ